MTSAGLCDYQFLTYVIIGTNYYVLVDIIFVG